MGSFGRRRVARLPHTGQSRQHGMPVRPQAGLGQRRRVAGRTRIVTEQLEIPGIKSLYPGKGAGIGQVASIAVACASAVLATGPAAGGPAGKQLRKQIMSDPIFQVA